MMKNKTLQKLMRFLITLLGAGLGAAAAAVVTPLLLRHVQGFSQLPYPTVVVYAVLCLAGAVVCFALSGAIIERTMRLIAAIERRWDGMSTRQILLTSFGLVIGLVVAALINQLTLSAGANLATITFSALTYVVLGYVGMRIGYRRYRSDKPLLRRRRRDDESASFLDEAADMLDEPDALAQEAPASPAGAMRKLLDTSVIIDGRILDIVKTGFLEGDIVVPQFVLAELRHVADSGDAQRRARGRRGLDVLGKLRNDLNVPILIDETDYPDIDEVDVKLLRLCRDKGGAVLTNDYNLNKVAGVAGIRVLNINDLANAVKPMLMAGEELSVHIVREGKEPGQGVAYLDDGTMIVVENGRRYVGSTVTVLVTTVLQTSAGRMIFTKIAAGGTPAGGDPLHPTLRAAGAQGLAAGE